MPNNKWPEVSVIVATYNEQSNIEQCLRSVVEGTLPRQKLEVLVVDGGSTDRTGQIVSDLSRLYPCIRLIQNPRRITPVAFNLGIRASRGENICILSAHAYLERDYLEVCLNKLKLLGADAVGGGETAVSSDKGWQAKTASAVLSSRFGVGSNFRTVQRTGPTGTATAALYRRNVFERIGLFDERLIRNQDNEFNSRLASAGGLIWTIQEVRSFYHSRATLRRLLVQNFKNGYYGMLTWMVNPRSFSLRHVVPLGFLLVLLAGIALGFIDTPIGLWDDFILAAYVAMDLLASVQQGFRYGWLAGIACPLAFPALHLAYGLGTLSGILRFGLTGAGDSKPEVLTPREEAATQPLPAVTPETGPQVSVIVATRNEERHIAQCLTSVACSTLPQEQIEIIVVDGGSTDGTRQIVQDLAKTYHCIRLIDNPERITPIAFNRGIQHSTGKNICILGAHSYVDPNYLEACLQRLDQTRADAVGGRLHAIAGDASLQARLAMAVVGSRFGKGSSFRTVDKEGPVDTVTPAVYRRHVFDRVGLFDPRLVRNQDNELNSRIRAAGMTLWMIPQVHCYYYPRTTLKRFFRVNFLNGLYGMLTWRINPGSVALRHLIPLLFVLLILVGIPLSLWSFPFCVLFVAIMGLYAAAAIGASLAVGIHQRTALAVVLPLVFFCLHVSYGIGTLIGFFRFGIGKLARVRPIPPQTD